MVNNEIISIIGIIVGLTLMIEIIFYGIVFPVLALSDLNKSSDINKATKVVYGILIVGLWTFGALIYSIFATKQKNLKIMTYVFFILLLIQAIVFYYIYKNFSGQNITFPP